MKNQMRNEYSICSICSELRVVIVVFMMLSKIVFAKVLLSSSQFLFTVRLNYTHMILTDLMQNSARIFATNDVAKRWLVTLQL